MAATIPADFKGGTLCIQVTGVAAATGGAIGAIENPFDRAVFILRGTWYVATPSTGAANISIGVGATATTTATDLINALAVNGAITGKAYNCHAMENTAKTEISAPARWDNGEYITFTGDASTVGLVATLYLECLPI